MLRSVKHIYGEKLGASDGEIGHVKDFYFDDQHWAVRYLVADTGSWIPGRLVLISPQALGSFGESGKILPVNLTREQIENSPAIESHKPVSRQYEEEYYRYYGWPYYWQGGGLWGMSGFPILEEGAKPFAGEAPTKSGVLEEPADVHLRSTKAVIGYQIQAGDQIAGHLTDFRMHDKSWVIGNLVINTGNRFSGSEALLSPSQVDRISWEESKIFVNLTKEAILQLPVYDDDCADLAKV